MPQILKKKCKFTLRWLLGLGNTSLEQNLRLETLGCLLFIAAIFFICCLTVPWLTFGYYCRNSFTHLMLITAFGLPIFGPKVIRRGWVSRPNWVPSGLWYNGRTNLATHPKLQKILSPDLHPDFPKCGNAPNTQNSYSLTLQRPLGSHISLDAKFSVQNF